MRAGVRASALRYYEQIGLLPAPPRSNGRRSYDLKVFDRLALIAFARRAGFSIAEVKLLMSGFAPDTTASARWRDLAKRKERELDAIIALAQERRRAVRAVQRCECRTLDECGHRLRIVL
jgi:MerR family redox-sensitive transcriptional activator SoxR